jgi:hypothetical protein
VTFKLIPSLLSLGCVQRKRKPPWFVLQKKENAPDSDLSWGVLSSNPPPKVTHNHPEEYPAVSDSTTSKIASLADNYQPQLQPELLPIR